MRRLMILSPKILTIVVLVAFFPYAVVPAYAKSPIKLNKWTGTIDSLEGISPFTLEGTASHLGQFTADGEVTFKPGADEGTLIGEGVIVFEAANGDLLVGIVEWDVDSEVGDERNCSIHFSWRDSVEFSNGAIVSSTGRFEQDRPPGLVVIAIIAVLTSLLLPAVQK